MQNKMRQRNNTNEIEVEKQIVRQSRQGSISGRLHILGSKLMVCFTKSKCRSKSVPPTIDVRKDQCTNTDKMTSTTALLYVDKPSKINEGDSVTGSDDFVKSNADISFLSHNRQLSSGHQLVNTLRKSASQSEYAIGVASQPAVNIVSNAEVCRAQTGVELTGYTITPAKTDEVISNSIIVPVILYLCFILQNLTTLLTDFVIYFYRESLHGCVLLLENKSFFINLISDVLGMLVDASLSIMVHIWHLFQLIATFVSLIVTKIVNAVNGDTNAVTRKVKGMFQQKKK